MGKKEEIIQISSDCALSVIGIDNNEEEMKKNCVLYDDKSQEMISKMINGLIHDVLDACKDNTVKQSIKLATENSYLIKLSPELHLAKSRTTEGAYRALGLDVYNHLKEQAELIPNKELIDLPKLPSIVDSMFNIASLITGEYYLSQINKKFDSINSGIERIEKTLEDSEKSNLVKNASKLDKIKKEVKYNQRDSEWQVSLMEISDVMEESVGMIDTYVRKIDETIKDNSYQKFEANIKKIGSYLEILFHWVNFYVLAKQFNVSCRAFLNKSVYMEQLKENYDSMKKMIDIFDKCCNKFFEWKNGILDNSKINKPNKALVLLDGLLIFGKAFEKTQKEDDINSVDDSDDKDSEVYLTTLNMNRKMEKKKALEEKCNQVTNQIEEWQSNFSSILLSYKTYNNIVMEGFDILKIGGRYYMRECVPISSSNG